MSVELGMIPVIVRRSALREAGIEKRILGSLGGASAADEHLYVRSFMDGADACNFERELLLNGIKPSDLASPGCDWVTLARCSPKGWVLCAFQYAYLTEAGPGEIAEMAGFAKRRPTPRPWTSWPPA